MSDQEYLSSSNLSFEDVTIPVDTRGYTLRRKIAITLWFALLTVTLAMLYIAYTLYNKQADIFIINSISVTTTLEADSIGKTRLIIPVFDWLRYPLTLLSTWLGYRSIRSLVFPPPIRTHNVQMTLGKMRDR